MHASDGDESTRPGHDENRPTTPPSTDTQPGIDDEQTVTSAAEPADASPPPVQPDNTNRPVEPGKRAGEVPRSESTEASIAGAVASIRRLADWLEEDQGHMPAQNSEELANFRQQMYLLDAVAANAQAGGIVAELLSPHVPPIGTLTTHPPSRMIHAVNQRALAGREPTIARWYPLEGEGRSAESAAELQQMARDYLAAIHANRSEIELFMQRGTQTNDPARARLLYALEIVATKLTGLPLRVFEYGACGGLNSLAHLYQYEWAGGRYGDPNGKTIIGDRWGAVPESQIPGVQELLGARPDVLEVNCCDLDPLQATDTEDQFRLAAGFLDIEIAAVRRILNAFDDARRADSAPIAQDSALTWLPNQLAQDRTGSCTVIWDSMLRRYLSTEENAELDRIIAEAGARATPDDPLIYGLFETVDRVETLVIRIFMGDGHTTEISVPTQLPNRTPGFDLAEMFKATGVLPPPHNHVQTTEPHSGGGEASHDEPNRTQAPTSKPTPSQQHPPDSAADDND